MCSQPPRNVDDDWIITRSLTPYLDRSTDSGVGFTGAAYSLGERFLEVLRRGKTLLPQTSLHVLSNGRGLMILLSLVVGCDRDPDLVIEYQFIRHLRTFTGTTWFKPDGAYDETVRGF